MKKTLIAIACGLALTAMPAEAGTLLTTTDSTFLGAVDPGSPANATDEASYINTLIGRPADAPPDNGWDFISGGHAYNRGPRVCGTCPVAVGEPTVRDASANPDTTDIDVTNWTWLLAKYGNTSFVWYVGDLTLVDLSSSLSLFEQTVQIDGKDVKVGSGGGLSHWSLYGPGGTVPDGGATLGLLGLGMLGLGYLRRRKN